jgi:hypothetical protein
MLVAAFSGLNSELFQLCVEEPTVGSPAATVKFTQTWPRERAQSLDLKGFRNRSADGNVHDAQLNLTQRI